MPRLKKQAFARGCVKCGQAFCKKCQSGTRVYGFCTQCLHIFVKKDGVSPASRKEKMEEIDHLSRREGLLCRVSSLLIPGFGSLYSNRIIAGMILLAVWVFSLVFLFYQRQFGNLWYFEAADGAQVLTMGCILLMGAALVVAQLPAAMRQKS
jgi:hypothetical protein